MPRMLSTWFPPKTLTAWRGTWALGRYWPVHMRPRLIGDQSRKLLGSWWHVCFMDSFTGEVAAWDQISVDFCGGRFLPLFWDGHDENFSRMQKDSVEMYCKTGERLIDREISAGEMVTDKICSHWVAPSQRKKYSNTKGAVDGKSAVYFWTLASWIFESQVTSRLTEQQNLNFFSAKICPEETGKNVSLCGFLHFWRRQ